MEQTAYIVISLLALSHTFVVFMLHKKRKTLDTATPEGAEQAKRIQRAILFLWIETPIAMLALWYLLTTAKGA